MGFIITLLIIIAGLLWWTHVVYVGKEKYKGEMLFTSIMGSGVAVVFCLLILGISYWNYIDLNQKAVTIQQYKSAMNLYVKHANAPTGAQGGQLVSDVTDQKYEDYQDNLDYYVSQYRSEVKTYNEILTGKKLLKRSWYWGTLIHCPAGMSLKMINMR